MKKIIASNLKTNHTRKSTNQFVKTINDYMVENNIENEVYIFPPITALDEFETNENLFVGVQNAYYTKNGSFTGEIGTEQLDEFHVKTILIGHSERRHILNEVQHEIALKFDYFKSHNYKIVYCVGEPLEVKQEGITKTLEYIFEQFEGIDLDYENLIIAYEPVWAIGTGIAATTQDIATIHQEIKKKINKPLLYGGSVKLCSLQDILEIENVDGVLVGTASWNVEDFEKMIYIGNKIKTLTEKFDCKN